MILKKRKLDKELDRLTDEVRELRERCAKKVSKPTLPLTVPLSLTDYDPVNNPRREAEMLKRRVDKMEKEHDSIRANIGDFRFTSVQSGIMGKNRTADCMGDEFAEAMCNFPIEDPYELCFAILYLLDQNDDYAWVYSFMTGVVCRAASMLPWGFERYVEDFDGFWFNDGEWIPSLPLNPEWYETIYAGEEYDDDTDPHDVSVAQIIYQNTGAILPRNMHRFNDAFRTLKKRGLKPSHASMVCALMNVLGEASRQRQYDPRVEDDLDWDDIIQSEKTEKPDSVAEENERLKKELAQLKEQAKKANYSLSRENRELKDQLEKASETVGEMRQELADLRDVVFNQQNVSEEEKVEESKITFPYRTTRRLVALGGHDSWLREIKFKLPDVRFVGDDISSPEIIRRADVVWIQTNCIGHKSYYTIIDLARKYGRKVRYFAYASATKCAEQVVEEENTVK